MRILVLTAVAILASFFVAAECPLSVPAGEHYVILTSHYQHLFPQDGHLTWSATTGQWYIGPTIANARSEAHPMGHEWVVDMMLAGECGEIPNPGAIFQDGFELGDTSRWSRVEGGS